MSDETPAERRLGRVADLYADKRLMITWEQAAAIDMGREALALLREIEPKYLKAGHQRARAALLARAGED